MVLGNLLSIRERDCGAISYNDELVEGQVTVLRSWP